LKLIKVHVTDFHSVRDSNEFEVGDITCLVGKNEAGKTAMLQAMYRLRPIVAAETGYSVTDDYPRRDVGEYEHQIEQGDRNHAVVAKLTFELEDDDLEAVSDVFGESALKSKVFTLSKAYEQKNTTFVLEVDELKAIQHLLEGFSVTEDVKERLTQCKTAKEVKEAVKGVEQTEAVKGILAWAEKIIKAGGTSLYIFNEILWGRVPQFMYFDEYYQMKGCDNIEQLKARVDGDKLKKPDYPLLGLIRLARLDLDGLLNPKRTRELKNKLEGAGNHLTASIVKYWSQNRHLQMRFDVRPARPEDPPDMRQGTNIASCWLTNAMRSSPVMPSSGAAQSRQRYGGLMKGLWTLPAIAALSSSIRSRSSRNLRNMIHVSIGSRSRSPLRPLSLRMVSRADLTMEPSC
jgi:hypothetical protein